MITGYRLIFVAVLVFYSCHSRAQTLLAPELFSPLLYQTDANKHLANKQVLRLTQDQQGFIWVGTRRGVFQFDGYRYQKLLASNAEVDLSKVYVRSLLATSDYLWIGTMSQGAYRVNLHTYVAEHFVQQAENEQALGGNQVNSIVQDENGEIWLGHSFGLDKFNAQTRGFKHFYSSDNSTERYHNYLIDIAFDANNTLWLATGKGTALMQTGENSFKLLKASNFPRLQNELLSDVIVRRFYLASDKRLWLATQKQGNFILNPSTLEVQKLTNSKARNDVVNMSIVEVGSSNSHLHQMWIAGIMGIEIRDPKTGELLKVLRGDPQNQYALAGDSVYPLLATRDGLIWLGVNDIGLQYFNPSTNQFLHFDRSQAQTAEIFASFINKVIPLNPQELAIFTEQNAYILDLAKAKTRLFMPDNTQLPRKLASGLLDKNGVFWLGDTNGKLYRVVEGEQTHVFTLPLSKNDGVFVRNLVFGKGDELWIGTDRGVVKLDKRTMTFSTLTTQNDKPFISFVRNLFVDSRNQLWIGTTSGLAKVLPNSKQANVFSMAQNTQQTLRHNAIFQVFENNSGEILVYHRAGIDKLQREENGALLFTPFAEAATDHVEVEDRITVLPNGNYWLGHRFVLNQRGEIAAQFSIADGALETGRGNDFFALDENYLMRVTPAWLSIANLATMAPWQPSGATLITDVQIDNQGQPAIAAQTEITLNTSQTQLAVRFTSSDFSRPEQNQYRYKLTGYDKDWVNTPSDIRQAKYTALPPGEYTLSMQASDRNGHWLTPAQLTIVVAAKFYQTILFYLIVGLLVSLASWWLFRWRLALAKQQQKAVFEQKQKIQRAHMMSELMEQKNRMFAEVTHDLRTPLATIKVQLEAMQDGVLQADEKTYSALQSRIGNLNQLVGRLYQISKSETFSQMQNNEQFALLPWLFDIVESFKPLFDKKTLALSVASDAPENSKLSADKNALTQVMSNLLQNSYHYTSAGGQVVISLSVQGDEVSIVVADSSPSIAPDELEKIFTRLYRGKQQTSEGSGLGLWICRSIVASHGGVIEAALSDLGGLAITIKLPINLSE